MGIQGFVATRRRWLVAFSTVAIVLSLFPATLSAAAPGGVAAFVPTGGDIEVTPPRAREEPLEGQEEDEDEGLLKQDDATITRRLAGDRKLSIKEAAGLRGGAADAGKALKKTKPPISPITYTGPWT